MPYEFTRKGYIEVYDGAVKVSQHVSEWEAMESISELPPGEYEIRFPTVMAKGYGVLAPPGGPIDDQPPTEPGSLVAIPVNRGRIDLTWTESTDNVGVTGYQIFRDSVPVASVGVLSYSDTGLTEGTQYSYEVTAFDAQGNDSTPAGPALATTLANSLPVWSIGQQDLETGVAYSLDLNTVCTDSDGDDITFSVVSGTLPSGLSLVGDVISGTPDTVENQVVTLGADDTFGTRQDQAVTFDVTTVDVTPPAVPTGLAVTGVTETTISLDWDDNTEPDFQEHRVFRSTDGTNFGLLDTVTISEYTDTGLSAGTQYWYRVNARDTTGNASAWTDPVDATTDVFSGGTPDYIQDWSDFSAFADTITSAAGNAIEADANMRLHVPIPQGGFDPDIYPYQRNFVTSPAREAGGISYRVENRRNVIDGANRPRVEITYARDSICEDFPGTTNTSLRYGVEYWFGYAVYLDSSEWPTSSSEANGFFMNVGQVPVSFTGGATVNNAVSWNIGGAVTWEVQVLPTGGSDKRFYKQASYQYPMNRWMDHVYRVRLGSSIGATDGICQVWIRDTVTGQEDLTMDYTGRLDDGHPDDGSSGSNQYIPTIGLYGGQNVANTTYLAYFSTIRAYIGTNGKAIVAPRN